MPDSTEVTPVDLDHVINYVARKTAARFRRWVGEDDLRQELHLYALDAGKKALDKAVVSGETWRVGRILFGVGRRYAETEKAAATGYAFEDLAWYDPRKLSTLVPLALDPKWDGLTGAGDETGGRGRTEGREGGNLLAMVVDVRWALGSALSWAKESDFDPDTELGMQRLSTLADKLGGEFPNSPGYQRGARRRAISNVTANVLTTEQEQGNA